MEEMIDRLSVADYLEARHLSDGGYFFARVEPSSGLDTFLAVSALHLLGVKPKDVPSIAEFWEWKLAGEETTDVIALALAVKTFTILGLSLTPFRKYRRSVFKECKRVEVAGSAFSRLALLIELARTLKVQVNGPAIASLIYASRAAEGGFIGVVDGVLSSTYYALKALNILGVPIRDKRRIAAFVNGRYMETDFLESLFYFVGSVSLLASGLEHIDEIVDFVSSCHRSNGGFSRSRVSGISTIEDTFMAVSILKTCERSLGRDLIG